VDNHVKLTVTVTNDNVSFARSYTDESDVVHVELDAMLLQAVFRGALVASSRAQANGSNLFSDFMDSGEANKTDDQLLQDFLTFRKKVGTAKAGNIFGDLKDAYSSEGAGRWGDMVGFSLQAGDVENRYVGVVLFIIAHELGHHVLHLSTACDTTRCAGFAQRELDADTYAGYLLGMMTAPVQNPFLLTFFDSLSQLSGYEVFFQDAYGRAEFVNSANAQCSCPYPAPQDRLRVAGDARHEAETLYIELVQNDPEEAKKLSIFVPVTSNKPPEKLPRSNPDLP
jgi:hypothetical protein